MIETGLSREERNARIVADWQVGNTSVILLAKKWGVGRSTITDVLRNGRMMGVVTPQPISAAPDGPKPDSKPDGNSDPQHLTARMLSDLNEREYRIVGQRGDVTWSYTIAPSDVEKMLHERNNGRLITVWQVVNGVPYLLARRVPVAVGPRGR